MGGACHAPQHRCRNEHGSRGDLQLSSLVIADQVDIMLGDHPIDVMLTAPDLGAVKQFHADAVGLDVLTESYDFVTFRCRGDSLLVITRTTGPSGEQQTEASWRAARTPARRPWNTARGADPRASHAARLACRLETSDPDNIAFYTRLGLEVIGERRPPPVPPAHLSTPPVRRSNLTIVEETRHV